MAKLNDELKDKIISDFNVGISQNALSKKYNLSVATINKLCKGKEPIFLEKVKTVATIKTELDAQSEYQAFTFNEEVNRLTKDTLLIHGVTRKLINKANEMSDYIDAPSDLNLLVSAVDKASLTLGVNSRHAKTEINNTANAGVSVKLIREEI